MAFHKLHAVQWDGLPVKPVTETTSGNERFLMPPSTAATLNLAATAAQCARVWRNARRRLRRALPDRCRARLAGCQRQPDLHLRQHPRQRAAAITATATFRMNSSGRRRNFTSRPAKQAYHDYLRQIALFQRTASTPGRKSAIYWGDVGVLGTLTLALAPDRLSADEQKTVQRSARQDRRPLRRM